MVTVSHFTVVNEIFYCIWICSRNIILHTEFKKINVNTIVIWQKISTALVLLTIIGIWHTFARAVFVFYRAPTKFVYFSSFLFVFGIWNNKSYYCIRISKHIPSKVFFILNVRYFGYKHQNKFHFKSGRIFEEIVQKVRKQMYLVAFHYCLQRIHYIFVEIEHRIIKYKFFRKNTAVTFHLPTMWLFTYLESISKGPKYKI